jgi:hypothetical protein
VEVRVHVYQRSFPEEPDRRVRTRREWMVDTALDKGCALSDRKDRARFGRTNVKCIGGVSDPRGPGAGRRRGQPIGGRSRPTGLRQRRGLRYRRHRAPPASDPRPLTGKNIEPRLSSARRSAPRTPRASHLSGRGNGAPEFRFPHPVPPSLESRHGNQGGEGGCVTVRPTDARADPGTGGAATL